MIPDFGMQTKAQHWYCCDTCNYSHVWCGSGFDLTQINYTNICISIKTNRQAGAELCQAHIKLG